jgi:beta-phosphoglucomutase
MIEAVIFDLDGVIVSTDEFHYQAWQELADRLGVAFDRERNARLRGVSRMESLDILLGDDAGNFTASEKLDMATAKNARYQVLLEHLSPRDILPGVTRLLAELRAAGTAIAIGSSSRNTPLILAKIGLDRTFDAVADGNRIRRSKPDPEVFLLAARDLAVPPGQCVVVEDADAGVEAGCAAGMRVFAVGAAAGNPRADGSAPDLAEVGAADLLGR